MADKKTESTERKLATFSLGDDHIEILRTISHRNEMSMSELLRVLIDAEAARLKAAGRLA